MAQTENPDVQAQAKPDVTVIMVPREQFSCTQESIESLYACTDMPFEFIFVDNNSPSETADYLRATAASRGFRLLRVNTYLSPSQCRNIGVRYAKTRYIAFVDNDVAFTPGWLAGLVDCAEDTGAEVVGPLMCQFEPLHEIIHCAGGQIMEPQELRRFLATPDEAFNGTADGKPTFRIEEAIHQQGVHVAEARDHSRRETGFIEFHCCLVRRDIIDRLGPFDEAMTTKEHLDFCLAVQRAGGRIVLEPKVVITYFAFAGNRMLKSNELTYYLLRWSDPWHRSSLEHFKKKWHLENDQYFTEKGAIGRWRRQLALANFLAHAVPGFGQMSEKLLRKLVRAITPIERLVNTAYANMINARAREARVIEVA